ncbi:phosphate acyltransferase [Pseudomonadota bacterium]
MKTILDSLKSRLHGSRSRLVLPEGKDDRILLAADRLISEDIARPIVLGNETTVSSRIEELSLSSDIKVLDPTHSDRIALYGQSYIKSRPRTKARVAEKLISKPLFFAGMMVREGDGEAMLAGVSCATSKVIEAGQLTIGLAKGIRTPSSCFLMIVPDFQGAEKLLIFADCAVNIEPDASQLADIAAASAVSARRILGEPPKVAMLSFSTQGSAQHPSVDKVREAAAMARDRNPDLDIDGEFQADTALIKAVADKKCRVESEVAGQANVLIFPNLDAGNIAYKLTQYLANAVAVGPLLQGFSRPVSDLSRGASVDDIVDTAVLLLATSGQRPVPD